jgi:hypothetical protein
VQSPDAPPHQGLVRHRSDVVVGVVAGGSRSQTARIDTPLRPGSLAAACTRPLIVDRHRGNTSYRFAKRSTHSSSRRERSNGMSRAEATVFGCHRDATASSIESLSLWVGSRWPRRRQYPHRHSSCCGMRIVCRFQFTHAVWERLRRPETRVGLRRDRWIALRNRGAGDSLSRLPTEFELPVGEESSWVWRVVSARR